MSSESWLVLLAFHIVGWSFFWFVIINPIRLATNNFVPSEHQDNEKKSNDYDYWEDDIDYDTGEVSANTRPAVRHPKNRDRAYSGSVERFHDGGR